MEAERKGGFVFRGRGRPDLRASGQFEHAPEAEPFVANTLVRILGALREFADSAEILGTKGPPAVGDQQFGLFGRRVQDERDLARVVAAAQDIVGILQQLQHGSSPVLLRHLIAQAGDSPVVGRPVPQLIEKGAHLTAGLLLDDPFALR
ncbi:MAG: hypothetical protein OXR82_02545 [Gammaproteobacteria bacterium]|nr:hypothetical protein [Gammaproteobacteria bacterium]